LHAYHQFTSRTGILEPYNGRVSGPTRNAILLAGGALAFAGLAGLSLWILPAPHQPLHYLLAGTLATAVTLAALLTLASLRGAFPEGPSVASHGRVVRLRVARGRATPPEKALRGGR
jgi:hypothetical protein